VLKPKINADGANVVTGTYSNNNGHSSDEDFLFVVND